MRTPAIPALFVLLAAWPAADAAAAPGDCTPGTAPPGAFRPYRVPAAAIYVHDGDTFYVGREAFRLRGVDAPELDEPDGPAAKRRLEQLLGSDPVIVVPRLFDVYCRVLVDVRAGGVDVAEALRRDGLAKPRWRRRR